ncbi:MAG: MFS transporter [Planctomycetes bacterium]|nr:MFS transporter [Planctomycetota bacterium]
MSTAISGNQRTVLGHPTGLFMLFFAEMWERFSYYGMRALLVFYMIKGFLQYTDGQAYAVYGAYTSMIYATPFIGGMLADRILGQRRAVVIGGLLMAAGHGVMMVESANAFFVALSLLILGNGFFKPNISTMVGALYPADSGKRDGGFTIFYMGVNLGAALSPLLCGYIGEKYGWHYGFGLATIGMLIGLAVFVMPTRVTQLLIGAGALVTAWSLVKFNAGGPQVVAVNIAMAVALVLSALASVIALSRGGFPGEVGQPKDPGAIRAKSFLGISNGLTIAVGVLVMIPVFALLLQHDKKAGIVLSVFGGLAFLSLIITAIRSQKVERQRLFVVFILMFFSMLFWAFFEQAGSSVNNFTDRNVDIVVNDKVLTTADVGTQVTDAAITQEFLGVEVNGKRYTLEDIAGAEKARDDADPATVGTVSFRATQAHVGMGIGGEALKASVFQAVNPIFILVFGLLLTALWGFLAARRIEPSTPIKFGLGLMQLGLGFGAFWYGAQNSDAHGFCGVEWLLLGYLLQTTGELCLSPVGLSMVTKLSPAKMVSTVMGGWFLAMAFSNFLAAQIAALTGVGHGEAGKTVIPPPIETIGVYGGVFGQIAIYALGAGLLVMLISPILTKWMHIDPAEKQGSAAH